MNELISCIMSNYNTDKDMLKESINSILGQTYSNFELIIVDDCSTDDSPEILREFEAQDSRVKILYNEKNSGLAYSMNKALKAAKGEYVARMDSDDIALNNRFEVQINYLKKNADISVLGSFARVFGSKNYDSLTPFYSYDDCKSQLLFSTCLIHPSVMFRKSFLEKNNLEYNVDFRCSQDFELWTRCIEYGNVAMVDKILLKYRMHNNQISIQKRALQREYAIEICNRQLKKLNISELDMDSHMVICGFNDISVDNIDAVMTWVKQLLAANEKEKIYSQISLTKILYNRIFNKLVKSAIPVKDKLRIFIRYKELIKLSNLYSIIYRIMFKLKQ